MKIKITGIFLLIISLFLTAAKPTLAQLEIADVYDLYDKEASAGDIIVFKGQGLARSAQEYDSKIFGIIESEPLAVYKRIDNTGTPIIRSGNSLVNVTTINGVIKKGDYVTSSKNLGKGQKATKSGQVIGVALADLTEKEGKIPVAIKIEYIGLPNTGNSKKLIDAFNSSLFRSAEDPEKFLDLVRYIGISLTDIITILVGLSILARVIPKSIEGIGRNPAAKRTIMVYTVANLAVVGVVIIIGLAISVLLFKI